MAHYPPPPHQMTLTDDNNYSDEEDSDEEFSLSRSRGPSHATPLKSTHFLADLPPPPPDDGDDFLSLDEIDKLQQQRKNTTTAPLSGEAFRSALRQSFSYNSRPKPGLEHSASLLNLAPPPPSPSPAYPPSTLSQFGGSSLSQHPSATTPSTTTTNLAAAPPPPMPTVQSNLGSLLGSGSVVGSDKGSTTNNGNVYGAMINGELVPYKMPLDSLTYPTSVTNAGTSYPATLDTLPKSPFLQYTPQHGRDFLQFQQVITSVDEAIRQSRSGQYAVKRLVKFIDQWCSAELRHIDSQTSIVSTEAFKCGHSTYGQSPPPDLLLQEKHFKLYCGYSSARSEQYDDMHRTQRSLISVFNTIEKEIGHRRKRITFSRKLISDLQAQAGLLDHRIRKCYEDYKQFTSEKVKEIASVRKLEKECQSLLKQAKLSLGLEKEEEEEKVAAQQQQGGSKFKFLASKLSQMKDKAKVSVAGGPKEFCEQLATLSEQYIAAIEKGNNAIALYHSRCNKLLGTLALVEAERVVLFNFTISQFSKTAFLTEQPIQLLYHQLLFSTFEMDPQYDFQEYLRRHRTSHGVPTTEPQEVYRLPVAPDDIRAMRLDMNPNSVFRVSLGQCMRLTHKTNPDANVPRIMQVLIAGVKKYNGFSSEGIFRISHQRDELISLRKQFENGNYDLPSTINSPHAPAALLKEWLRELADALIPTESYTMWMSEAKKIAVTAPGSTNIAPGGRPQAPNTSQISQSAFALDKTTEGTLLSLYSLLDDVNQNVIREIAMMCVEISHPLNQRVNRMTVENLAIVFAPSFFRNPSDDTNDILLNSKNETKMTSLLLAAVGSKYFDYSALDQAYNLLPPSQQLGGNATHSTAGGGSGGAGTATPSTPLTVPMSPGTPSLSPMNSSSFFNNHNTNNSFNSTTSSSGLPPSRPDNNNNNNHSSYDDSGRNSGIGQSLLSQQSFNTAPSSSLSHHPPPSSIFSQPIPENAPSTPSPSHSHFGRPPPPMYPNGAPSTPSGSTSSFFSSPPPVPGSLSGQPQPPLPPRRGTFVLPQNQVLPPHPGLKQQSSVQPPPSPSP